MLKRAKIITVLTVLIAIIATCASAESIDVSLLNDEELLALKDVVLSEIELRHLNDSEMYGKWYDFGLGQILPDPVAVFGRTVKQYSRITNNDDKWFTDNIDEVTADEFNLYVAAVRLYGFNENISASGISFKADNSDGIHIRLSHLGKVLYVDLKAK